MGAGACRGCTRTRSTSVSSSSGCPPFATSPSPFSRGCVRSFRRSLYIALHSRAYAPLASTQLVRGGYKRAPGSFAALQNSAAASPAMEFPLWLWLICLRNRASEPADMITAWWDSWKVGRGFAEVCSSWIWPIDRLVSFQAVQLALRLRDTTVDSISPWQGRDTHPEPRLWFTFYASPSTSLFYSFVPVVRRAWRAVAPHGANRTKHVNVDIRRRRSFTAKLTSWNSCKGSRAMCLRGCSALFPELARQKIACYSKKHTVFYRKKWIVYNMYISNEGSGPDTCHKSFAVNYRVLFQVLRWKFRREVAQTRARR